MTPDDLWRSMGEAARRLNPHLRPQQAAQVPAAPAAAPPVSERPSVADTALDDHLWVLHVKPAEAVAFLETLPETGRAESFEGYVDAVAKHFGWTCFHARDSRRQQLVGLPDLILLRNTVVFAELKSKRGRVEPHQRDVLDRLSKAGMNAYLWRPADWPAILRVLER